MASGTSYRSVVCTAREFLNKHYLLTYKYRENNMLNETTMRLHGTL